MLCFLLSVSIFSQNRAKNKGVIFNDGTLAETLAKAKNNKKGPNLVFLDCYTTWCGPCKAMSNNVFPQEHVGDFFNANFVNIKIDMEKGEGIEIKEKYNVQAYPTFLILDAEGNEINRIVGGGDADGFIEKVKKAMNPQNSPKAKRAAYDNEKSIQNAIAYLEILESSYMKKEASQFIEEIFPTLTPKERYSEKMWPYVSESLANPNSTIFDLILKEKPIADRYISKERVDAIICRGLKNYASNYVKGRTTDQKPAEILTKIEYLNLLSNRDASVPYITKAAKLYSTNDIDAIVDLLEVNQIMRLSSSDIYSIEKFLLGVKGMSKKQKLDYLKAKQEYLTKQAAKLGAHIDKLSK